MVEIAETSLNRPYSLLTSYSYLLFFNYDLGYELEINLLAHTNTDRLGSARLGLLANIPLTH